ncbi:unnamed protein product [Pylaiella littoralis]
MTGVGRLMFFQYCEVCISAFFFLFTPCSLIYCVHHGRTRYCCCERSATNTATLLLHEIIIFIIYDTGMVTFVTCSGAMCESSRDTEAPWGSQVRRKRLSLSSLLVIKWDSSCHKVRHL